jgi:hypothetical protein
MALFRRLSCRRCRATFLEDQSLAWSAGVLLGGRSRGMWPSSMGGWSQRSGGRPLWAAGLEGMVAVLYGRLVSKEWWPSSMGGRSRNQVQSGGVGGGSTPGHQELLEKDRERKKVGNEVHMRWNDARGVSKGKANT